MKKLISIVSVCGAIIAASAAAIVVATQRADAARAYAEAAASEEVKAEAERKAEQAAAQQEADKRRTAEASEKAEADRLAAAKLAQEQALIEQKTAEENRLAKEAEAVTAKAEAEKASANRDAAKLTADTAKAEKAKAADLAKAEEAKARGEEAKLAAEQLKSEKVIAEAKLLELRKIDFETAQQTLNEWRLDLEEREAALAPEKTIADLAWAGEQEDMTVDENGDLKKIKKAVYSPETDRSLPRSTRWLAKVERLAHEAETNELAQVRASVVRPLEKLYVEAIRENRVIDAEYYKKTLKSLYPDWEFKGE